MSFWNRISQVARYCSVLRHPFYVRWSEGTLTAGELADYSSQYRHAVVALAHAATAAARSPEAREDADALADHAAVEARHVTLWDQFVTAAGGSSSATPTPETRACARTWAGEDSRPLLETLVAMYAIESAQPGISAVKRAGLAEHYGIHADAYFRVHERLDVEHAAELRAMIDRRLGEANEDALLATAEDVLTANWRLLDSVDRA